MSAQVRRVLTFAALGACVLASPAHAHRFHVSIADAEFNESSQRLEVALNINARDAEEALGRHGEWAQPAKDRSEIDRRLSTYVAERWSFFSADGQTQGPTWLGYQIEGEHLWLYFEVTLPGGLDGARIENRMFFELDPRQVNTVNFREGDWRFSVAFSRDRRTRTLSRIEPEG